MLSPIKIPRLLFFSTVLATIGLITACSDFFEPVDSTPSPSEYTYNYWLLQKTYLYEDELPLLDENGDSVSELYSKLSDPYTRYVPPSKSEQAISQMNTSIVPGDVGMEYTLHTKAEHPIYIYRVYQNSPANRAGVPRYGNILKINGTELRGENAYGIYDSVLTYNKDIELEIAHDGDTLLYPMSKEDIYAPTVFVDTMGESIVVTITGFKLNTVNQELGTYGELRAYLDSTKGNNIPRLIDLRNNPGGHVEQCVNMADLFIEKGVISTRRWRSFLADGQKTTKVFSVLAQAGDPGENENFAVLVNERSASCAEIFTIAVQEGAGIPVVGTTTFGKGIGQSTWKTKEQGVAIITNLEFLSPLGNSYNLEGITPDTPCDSAATLQCGLEALDNLYKKNILEKKQQSSLTEATPIRKVWPTSGALFEMN